MENPVLKKELLSRFRARQGKSQVVIFWVCLALVVVLVHYWVLAWLLVSQSASSGGASMAWESIVMIEFTLILLIGPSAAANTITQEREQQTWDMLVFTRLTALDIILGKLAARLIAMAAIVVLFLPLSLLCWVRSSWSTQDSPLTLATFICANAVLVASIVLFTTVGMAASFWTRRTLYAIMLAYTVVIGGLCIGVLLLEDAFGSLAQSSSFEQQFPLMWLNPVYLLALAFNHPEPTDAAHLYIGIVAYFAISALLLWSMVGQFRRETT